MGVGGDAHIKFTKKAGRVKSSETLQQSSWLADFGCHIHSFRTFKIWIFLKILYTQKMPRNNLCKFQLGMTINKIGRKCQ
jgi:hypothetical protein